MKNTIAISIIMSLLFALTACNTSKKLAEKPLAKGIPVMKFDRILHDFGPVKKGEKRETTFHFTNEGDVDLEIEIITSCHCTTLDYSLIPVPPKGSGKIHAIFDSSEKTESETIDITIILKNTYPENDYPVVEEVKYKYQLIE